MEVLIGRNGACPKASCSSGGCGNHIPPPNFLHFDCNRSPNSHAPAGTFPNHSAFSKYVCAGTTAGSTSAVLIRCFVALLSTAQVSNGTCDHGHFGAAEDTTHESTTRQWSCAKSHNMMTAERAIDHDSQTVSAVENDESLWLISRGWH